jgi:hypothetical protein
LLRLSCSPHERQVVVALGQTGDGLAAHRVGEGRMDDLDDVCAPVGEHGGAGRAEREHRQLDHTDAL